MASAVKIGHGRIMAAMVLAALVAVCTTSSCSPQQHSSGYFSPINAGEGWDRSMPIVFEPQYNDSSATYDIVVAVRHTHSYEYSNLHVVVDLMADSNRIACRIPAQFDVADEYGNWHGTGFGTFFQCKTMVAQDVSPSQARKVVIWQAMADTVALRHITEVGIIVSKH
ncbi:MAG: gliding motility lipoprotein GldH [Muribaculaceae bacterium]|nr:gliding motility lipoprotein GldH [Muribaculaceae bacterium]